MRTCIQNLHSVGGADKRGNVVANHLGDDRFAGGIVNDGPENFLFQSRFLAHAKVFGEVKIRSAVSCHEMPER